MGESFEQEIDNPIEFIDLTQDDDLELELLSRFHSVEGGLS